MTSPEFAPRPEPIPEDGDSSLKAAALKKAVQKAATAAADAIQVMPYSPKLFKGAEQNAELATEKKKMKKLLDQAKECPDSIEKILMLRAITNMAQQRYRAINIKYQTYREVRKIGIEKMDRLAKNSTQTSKNIQNTGIDDYALGHKKQLIASHDAESDHHTAVFNAIRKMDDVVKNADTPTALREIENIRKQITTSNTNYSASDAAYQEVLKTADNWEGNILMVDEGIKIISSGVPFGPEVYAGMRSAGLLIGGETPEKVREELIKSYAEARLGVTGRVVVELAKDPNLIEHIEKLLNVADDAAGFIAEYGERTVGYAGSKASEYKTQIATFLTKEYVRRKHPKLAIVKGFAESLLDGKGMKEALQKTKYDIARAARKSGKLAEKASTVGVKTATDKLTSIDQKIDEFRSALRAKFEAQMDPEELLVLEEACVEQYRNLLKQAGQ